MGIAGVVLAGGQSRRMGQDKSQLKIQGKTLLQHTSKILSNSGVRNNYISGQYGIQDEHPDKGPIGGMLSCLNSLRKFSSVLFIPVDMPLLTKEIIKELINQSDKDLVHFEKYNLPLIIKNNKNTRNVLAKQVYRNILSVHELIKKLESKTLKTTYNQELFANANSPEQWVMVTRKLLKQ